MTKAIGTHREDPLVAASHAAVAVALRDMHPKAYLAQRQVSQKRALRQFDRLAQIYSTALDILVIRAKEGDNSAKRAPLKLMNKMYREAFSCGLMAGGRPVLSTGVYLTPKDEKWVASAVTDEAKYWRKFMQDVLAGSGRMTHERRKEMYVRTLRSLYESGKVKALPEQVLLYWVINSHKENCPECQFMAENGPYTKETLPITPRSGATSCKSNCGCHIMVKHVDALEYTRVKIRLSSKKELLARLKRVRK